jgi:hypothetical protein
MVMRPALPLGGVTRLVLRSISYHGSRFQVAFDKVTITVTLLDGAAGENLHGHGSGSTVEAAVTDAHGTKHPLSAGVALALPVQRLLLTCRK